MAKKGAWNVIRKSDNQTRYTQLIISEVSEAEARKFCNNINKEVPGNMYEVARSLPTLV